MRLMDFRPSEFALLAWSSPISSSLISPSSAFLTRRASPLAFCSASREADIDSMARWWFFLVLLNSSSFSASLAELIEEILDLIRKVLVLPLDNVELLNSLVSGGLQPEQLRRVVATFILGGGHLSSNISSLGLPLAQHLVKVLSSLLSDEGSSVHSLVLHADIIKVSSHSSLGLLSIGHLGGENINQFLTLHNLGLELATGSLQFLHTAHTLCLIARLPQLDLGLVLGQGLEGIRLPHV